MNGKMRIELSGTDTAFIGDLHVTASAKKGPVCLLARQLVANGHSPDTPVEVYRNGTPVFAPAPLSHYANYDVTESDSTGLKRKPYVEFVPFS